MSSQRKKRRSASLIQPFPCRCCPVTNVLLFNTINKLAMHVQDCHPDVSPTLLSAMDIASCPQCKHLFHISYIHAGHFNSLNCRMKVALQESLASPGGATPSNRKRRSISG